MTDYRTRIDTFPTYLETLPTAGERMARVLANIDASGAAVVSLNAPNVALDYAQGVYIDNDTLAVITLTHRTTGFRIIARPRTQGWYKLIMTNDATFDVTSSVVNSIVSLMFVNTPVDTVVMATA